MEILLNWRRVVDFFVLAGTLYVVLRWASRARALRIVLAIIALYAAVLMARQFDLLITAWILQGAALISVALLVIVFQPEVRRALTRLDRRTLLAPRATATVLDETLATSAFELAAHRTGALFVVVGQEPIDELLEGGAVLAADISDLLIEAIFQKSSPLHDGAMIIDGARVARAGAVLPLTQRRDVPPEYGTRHRAAMGMAERSDALCIAVSEERGEVTVMRGGSILQMQTPQQLASLLDHVVLHSKLTPWASARLWIFSSWRVKLAALGLSALIWSVATFDTSSSVRVVDVPIEFQNVPAGLDLVYQSSSNLSIEVRGRTWMMNSNQVAGLLARFNLSGSKEGYRTLRVEPASLGLPPGVRMIRSTPASVEVRLIHPKAAAAR